ncbi:MAG TPA: N-acetylmuramoyl-L-alanine amidase [Candidatus Anaerotignum merdipullorum]|nr:N-acetylmuramoyl-L-alanine amidase [Candidatus Anaerotignum merdipullorum]
MKKWRQYWRQYVLFLLCGMICFCVAGQQQVTEVMLPVAAKTIVLDAGHGGWDPGKTGSAGRDEQELNLAIVQKLQAYLEQGGARVYVTRADDKALGENKQEDMRVRKEISNGSGADLLISVHQNAFPSSSAKGAQVFYHTNSTEGKALAECIQESLRQRTDTENTRQVKANGDYYILRTTEIPAALVECGFLSNAEEERKLNEEEYQERMAWGIYCGILAYFAAKEDGGGLQANQKQI